MRQTTNSTRLPELAKSWSILLHFAVLATALLAFIPEVFAQNDDEFVVDVGELKRIDSETGAERWTIRHASAWESAKRERQWCELLGPIEVDQGWFYTFCGDLLRFDVEKGIIEERIEFPAKIVGFARVDDETLQLTVDLDADDDDLRAVELTYRPGESPPPRARWALMPTLAIWKEVTNLHPKIAVALLFATGPLQDKDPSKADHRAAIEAIEARRGQDPGNPFYDFFAATHHEQLGQADEATRLYASAAENEAGSWWTDAMLSTLLEAAGRSAQATDVWERALRKVDERFPTFRRHSSLVAQQFYWGIWGLDDLTATVEREEVEKVDRVNARLFAMGQRVEAGGTNWRVLADWFGDQGHPELAQKWRANAEIAGQSAGSSWITGPARRLDFAFLFLIALLIATPFAAWFTGARASSSRRADWLPRPRRRDLAGLAILILCTAGATGVMNISLKEVEFRAAVPIPATMGAWDSPDVAPWLERLEPSQERDDLIDHARAVSKATTEGTAPPTREDAQELLAVAIERNAMSGWAEHSPSWGAGTSVPNPFAPKLWMVLPWLLFIGFLTLLGHLARRALPRATQVVSYLTPGCAKPAGPVGGVMTALFAAALLALTTPLDAMFTRVALPPFNRYFGLESQWPPIDFFISTGWAWISLAIVLVAHVATVVFDLRNRDPQPAPDER